MRSLLQVGRPYETTPVVRLRVHGKPAPPAGNFFQNSAHTNSLLQPTQQTTTSLTGNFPQNATNTNPFQSAFSKLPSPGPILHHCQLERDGDGVRPCRTVTQLHGYFSRPYLDSFRLVRSYSLHRIQVRFIMSYNVLVYSATHRPTQR